jgi:hypothetical protein
MDEETVIWSVNRPLACHKTLKKSRGVPILGLKNVLKSMRRLAPDAGHNVVGNTYR